MMKNSRPVGPPLLSSSSSSSLSLALLPALMLLLLVLNLDWIEEFLQLPGILGHFWRIEQTLYALCSSRYGVELLPEEYDVFLKGNVGERPSRHYVGAIRHEMYREGMRKLVKQGFLKDIAKA